VSAFDEIAEIIRPHRRPQLTEEQKLWQPTGSESTSSNPQRVSPYRARDARSPPPTGSQSPRAEIGPYKSQDCDSYVTSGQTWILSRRGSGQLAFDGGIPPRRLLTPGREFERENPRRNVATGRGGARKSATGSVCSPAPVTPTQAAKLGPECASVAIPGEVLIAPRLPRS
jgi:hypothetical protein